MRLLGEPESFRPSVAAHFATRVIRNRWFLVSLAAYTVSFFGFMALLSIEGREFRCPRDGDGLRFGDPPRPVGFARDGEREEVDWRCLGGRGGLADRLIRVAGLRLASPPVLRLGLDLASR